MSTLRHDDPSLGGLSEAKGRDKAERMAALLREDPAYQERMRRFRLAMNKLAKDSRRHNTDEIKDTLSQYGYRG